MRRFAESLPEDVLRASRDSDRTLLTFDKDFGELVLRRGLEASRGVDLFRVPLTRPSELAQSIAGARARDGIAHDGRVSAAWLRADLDLRAVSGRPSAAAWQPGGMG